MMNVDAPDVSDHRSGTERGISPALDAALELLSNSRRRYVLYHLREQGGAVTVDELAERVAEWEGDTDEPTNRQRVRTDLHHSQLPRMDEMDVISFDTDTGLVTLSERDSSPLSEYLDLAAEEENVV